MEETEAKMLKEKLFNKKEVGWNKLSDAMMNSVMKFCDEYMYFLNNGKTERECASFTQKMLEDNGFVSLDSKEALDIGDKVYYINRIKSVYAAVIGEELLENGLNIMIIPKKNIQKKYIMWVTHYGSIDNRLIVPGETEETYGREVKGQSSDLIQVEKVEHVPREYVIDAGYDPFAYDSYAESGFEEEVVDIAKIETAECADKQTILTYFKNASFDGKEIDGICNMMITDDDFANPRMEIPLGEKLEDVHTITLKNAVYDLRYDFTFNLSR